jgi:hypothetical protein
LVTVALLPAGKVVVDPTVIVAGLQSLLLQWQQGFIGLAW